VILCKWFKINFNILIIALRIENNKLTNGEKFQLSTFNTFELQKNVYLQCVGI